MTRMIRLSAATVTVFTLLSAANAEEIKGKDVVAAGTVQTLSGTLKEDGGHEWLLVTAQGTYELHLGPEAYRESKKFTLAEDQKVEVKGFVFEKHVAPITIKTDQDAIVLRDEAGKSAWAGTEFSGKKGK
jgi:hypothetical protein